MDKIDTVEGMTDRYLEHYGRQASLAIRRFFLLAKISGVKRSVRRMPSKALATEG